MSHNANTFAKRSPLWPMDGRSGRERTGHAASTAADVDQDKLRDTLLLLAAQVGGETTRYTLADTADAYEQTRVVRGLLKSRTLAAHHRSLRRCRVEWGALEVDGDFTKVAAEFFYLEGRTAWRYLQMLRTLLLFAQRQGWRASPHGLDALIRKSEYLPREAVYTERQLADFLAACERLDRAGSTVIVARAREVLRALALTGCRLREIVELRTEEVFPGYLRLLDSKTGSRKVPLGPQAELVIGRQTPSCGLVFPGKSGSKPIGVATVQRAFRAAKEEAGLKDGVVHTLRHSVITIAIRNNVPMSVVQKQIGHEGSSYVTKKYLHLTDKDAALACFVVEQAIERNAR